MEVDSTEEEEEVVQKGIAMFHEVNGKSSSIDKAFWKLFFRRLYCYFDSHKNEICYEPSVL